MKFITLLIFGFCSLMMTKGSAQDLSSHKWENRIVVVKADDLNNDDYQNQIKELKQDVSGLTERKIIVYQVNKLKYKKGLTNNIGWKEIDVKSKKKYLKNSSSDFEVILIGLDGGVKLRQNEVLLYQKLFSKIDAMPMRVSEMKRSKRKM